MARERPWDLGTDPARPARILTFALMAVAYAACEVAAYLDGIPRPFGVAYGLVLFTLAVLASHFVPAPTTGVNHFPRRVSLILGVVLVLPLVAEPAMRWLTGNGFPLEMQLVNGLRNVGLALTAVCIYPKARRLAGIVALFLTLFASAMGDQPAIPYLLVLLAILGGLWLIADHRAGLGQATLADSTTDIRRVRMRLPTREAAVFGLLFIGAVGLATAGPKQVRLYLGEWMPTSGGTQNYDPFSRGGVNDGPEETSGDDPTGAGMVDSGTLIETQGPSLVDVASDMVYGKPHKPPKNQERMIAGGVEKVKESHKTPENKRPNRDFDTGRKGPSNARKAPGQEARGLIEVEGRTPLHIRVVVYDRYDATEARWLEATHPANRLLEAESEGSEWMVPTMLRGQRPWYGAEDRHRLKVAQLRDNLLPTPTMTTRFRVKRIREPDFYEPDFDGVWTLSGRSTTPSGTIVHTDCQTLDAETLPPQAFCDAAYSPLLSEVPESLRPELRRIAKDWSQGQPRGWPQIAAIRNRLRSEYVVDRQHTAPVGHPNPLFWFLQESRRGPDYLFSTALALLVRELGYPARVCMGFYAAPENYDSESDHTPIREKDLHFWPELLLTDGHWLVVEPTPGYELLALQKPLSVRIREQLVALFDWGSANRLPLSLALALTVVVILRRHAIADTVRTLSWRFRPGRTWNETALRATRLLEYRSRLVDRPRAEHETLKAWAKQFQPDESLQKLLESADWAAYGTLSTPPPWDVQAICRRAVAGWPRHRFRAQAILDPSGDSA